MVLEYKVYECSTILDTKCLLAQPSKTIKILDRHPTEFHDHSGKEIIQKLVDNWSILLVELRRVVMM